MTLYTYGYVGGGLPPLQKIAAAGIVIVDIRASPTSYSPGYRKAALREMLRDRYTHLPALGNVNYRNGGPIQLRHEESGLADLCALLALGPICILCGCQHWHNCHRERVARLAAERLPGLQVVHLDPDSIERVEEKP